MDITLREKRKYVVFYRGEKLIRFWVTLSRLRVGFKSKTQWPLHHGIPRVLQARTGRLC